MQKPILAAEPFTPAADTGRETRVRVAILTLDTHIASAADQAEARLQQSMPGLSLRIHAASEWDSQPGSLAAAKEDLEKADIIVATMMFMDEHLRAILPVLEARRDACDAMAICVSAGEAVRLTKLGGLSFSGETKGPLALLKRLRGTKKNASSGAGQMAMLRRLPKILRFIPGKAQDLRAYFLTMQYWLSGSEQNIEQMVRFLISRYAGGDREALRAFAEPQDPVEYPETGCYHPDMRGKVSADRRDLPNGASGPLGLSLSKRLTVGLLLMRSYLLAGDADHYNAVIRGFEAKGIRVIPAFAAGLDARPAVERFFLDGDRPMVDAVVSLTGFSLVGGPAYNDAEAAAAMLEQLGVPYLAAHALEFQTLDQWAEGERGLTPIEATMMVAIPEIDGATGPMIFGGRTAVGGRRMRAAEDRVALLVARTERLMRLRHTPATERRIAVTLFNFPPNAGATGTAAFLDVFASLHNTLRALRDAGYETGALPETADALREAVTGGNAERFGADGNVFARIAVDDYVSTEPHLAEIEAQWGPAPGKHQTDGRSLYVLGLRFGNVFVGLQPGFGYEGDPMRLLFERGFAPTHAFSAYYRWLREDFDAHAVLHFGTHGALEFMPGKQTGLSAACWPERLIGDLPNIYLYAANNPSEGSIAKRRSAATLVSYLTPPVATAGLYKGLADLKAALERWRGLEPEAQEERAELEAMIAALAEEVDLAPGAPEELNAVLLELEYALIPHGLHVVGRPPSAEARAEMLESLPAETDQERTDRLLAEDHEIPGLLKALDGRFVAPGPAGDLIRTPDILPTGRNLHGFDPFRLPSAFAVEDGARQAARLLARHQDDGGSLPRTVAMVLWGTDNLKTEGAPIAQAMALMGARPRFDSYGRLCGAELVPLDDLGRPRIDAVVTLSGIFRDLLPLQTRMLAEAAFLAATADEPDALNFIRAHALATAEAQGCDLETAALRVFSNADGAYGSNVNHLIDSGAWEDEDELADAFQTRKCFAYGRHGTPEKQPALFQAALSTVDLSYQNLESVELGVTTIDHYFDTLGGIGRAVTRARGTPAPTYIGDQTRGDGKVRTLSEQVALETRTRTLNPKWYEGMLSHGYEGVRQIEHHVTNTMGWSATTGDVEPWVYQQITRTFVLDEEMRDRLARLNPKASARVANRLIEAHERQYWEPDEATLEALRAAGDELEDRLEGILPDRSSVA